MERITKIPQQDPPTACWTPPQFPAAPCLPQRTYPDCAGRGGLSTKITDLEHMRKRSQTEGPDLRFGAFHKWQGKYQTIPRADCCLCSFTGLEQGPLVAFVFSVLFLGWACVAVCLQLPRHCFGRVPRSAGVLLLQSSSVTLMFLVFIVLSPIGSWKGPRRT